MINSKLSRTKAFYQWPDLLISLDRPIDRHLLRHTRERSPLPDLVMFSDDVNHTLIFPRSDTQYHVLVQWLDYCQMSLKNNQMLSEHCQKLPNVWAIQNTTKKAQACSVQSLGRIHDHQWNADSWNLPARKYAVIQTNWNYNSLLSSVCLFYRQRIHFKRQIFNNQVVLIAQGITLPSKVSQSELPHYNYDDPRGLIALHWRHQEQTYWNLRALIGWE